MNKNILYFVLIIISLSCDNQDDDAQEVACDNGAFVGDVSLTTQQELDEFGAMCYSSIIGRLDIISDDDIDNLKALSSLREITSLTYINVPQLTSLEGLQNLEKLGHHFTLSELVNLKSIRHLSSLKHAEAGISLNRLPLIENLRGLENLTYLNSIGLSDCPSLNSIEALNASENIFWGRIDLYKCPLIASLSVFQKIERVGIITIAQMDGLETLHGLHNMSSSHSIHLSNNKNLTSLSGLDKLTEMFGLYLRSNGALENLNGLEALLTALALDIGRTNYGTTYGNPLLSDFCALQNLFSNGTFREEDIHIENNAYNPSVQDLIAGNCSE